MFDVINPEILPPPFVVEKAPVVQVKRKSRRGRRTHGTQQRRDRHQKGELVQVRVSPGMLVFVGMVLLMDNGQECMVHSELAVADTYFCQVL